MKKSLFFLVVSFFIFQCNEVSAEERIQLFDVDIVIAEDAKVSVVEKITYDFDDYQKHGIYRTIPYKYKARGGNFTVQIDDVEVYDEEGKKLTHQVKHEGDNIKIRIGEYGFFVTGVKQYEIRYTMDRVINYFDAHDELYWNVTGNEWEVPIDEVRVHASTPGNIIQQECFAGVYGSSAACDHNSLGDAAHSGMEAGRGVTVVFGVEKGYIAEPAWWQELMRIIKDNFILLVPIGVFVFMARKWAVYGRDPEGQGTIVPQWEIPQDLAPMQVGIIVDERAQRRDLSSLFIDLAIRGHFKIRKEEKKGLLGKKDYTLVKTNPQENDALQPFEKKFIEGLFANGTQKEVKISSLKNSFYKDVEKIVKTAYKGVTTRGYFVKNPKTVRGSYLGVGIVITFFSIWGGGMISQWISPFVIVVGVVSGITVMAFSLVMPKRTKKGVVIREKILGLKQYMESAEKRRIDFHNAPEKNPQTFEKYLPYAMVLGVETEWANQFDDVYKGHNPSWYEGGDFSATSLTRATSGFASAAHTAAVAKPSSSSSGGSGFSGGGSGGGFGGGGGGSW